MSDLKPLIALKEKSADLAGKKIKELLSDEYIAKLSNKGTVGQILEIVLGADSGGLPQPDFAEIGVELKTLPVLKNNVVKESTFICAASLLPDTIDFFQSLVYKKLQHVLFIPYEAEKNIPLMERRIGTPFFWQPNEQELALLKQDYEGLMQQIITGNIAEMRAIQGEVLQIRPKGLNKKVLTRAIDAEGETVWVNARGFYLRQRFTQKIITRVFHL